MSSVRAVALALLVTGCTYEVRSVQPPVDQLERRRAEVAACSRGALPPWLDNAAVGAAVRTDRREAEAGASNESFHGAAYTSQPPASTALATSRTAALLAERSAFERWCAGMRAAPGSFARP